LTNAGYDAAVQPFGTAQDVLIRLPEQSTGTIAERNTVSDNVVKTLSDVTPGVTLQRVEFVGPQIGDELRDQGGIAMLLALAGILIYVALRFEFRFSVSAIAALVHDVTITVGFFSITGMEFDLTTLAAILAIIGYSLNDTIVVFDRIRENFLKLRKAETADSIDLSINETLSRTLMTSLTTVIVVVSLFVFGGEIIHSFSVAMLVGITIGTYSSIYVASTSLIAMGVTRDSLLPPAKDETDEDLDAIP
jgi:preprotein translocase subunit SecF